MSVSPSHIDKQHLTTLIGQTEQLLDQMPPSRNVRRIATEVRQLAQADSQPLQLTILGDDKAACEALSDKLMQTKEAVVIRCSSSALLANSPSQLQATVQWSEVAFLVPPARLETLCDQDRPSDATPLHCFRNLVVVCGNESSLPDDYAHVAHWPLADKSNGESGQHLASVLISSKRLARAQRLSACTRQLRQLVIQSVQHYKTMLGQLEPPARSTLSRSPQVDCDKIWLPMRDAFGERTVTIDRELAMVSERATQPLGELSGLLRSIVNGMTEDDLESSRTSSQLKLSVNAGHLATLNRRFEHTLHERFTRDLKHAEQLIRAAMDESYRQHPTHHKLNDSKFSSIDIQRAWRSVENLMAIGKEAAIELPRRGVFDLLTAGRQKVFIIIMFISLMGRMGLPKLFETPVAHLGFGVFMATVMLASMVSAIGRWRKENAQTIEKEIQKFREHLLSEGSKVIDQVERVKLNTVREYIKDACRSFESICKTQIESDLRQQQTRAEELQQRQEAARKVLDARLKQVAEAERPVQRLADAVEAYCEACRLEHHRTSASSLPVFIISSRVASSRLTSSRVAT